ncbi:hypothetical protein UFOVP19_55 [uncultured Caudovirales phage]|uniref:Uncharacterized protein n=1 Tax=uncultured Caudovirales phage TaxID=2100421 RepID=A0A6J5KKA3_9CAUD|nr:hypothetical protein UFOVP19_55 [uncultured Caudovirales phage]
MAENLNLNVNVNTSSASGSIGSLKKQLREAQNEVVALSDKFGATSVQAVNAAKKAAELRDRIGDAKALTDAFNPDAKFKALTASLSGVAGGFGAVQGAMSLFGKESDDVAKTLLKVQSAMALSQGLQAVGESIDSFKNLATVIKTAVIESFTTLRGAMIATGVGALAVGVGMLVANFKEVKSTLISLFPDLAGFGDKVMDIVHAITDFIGVTSQQGRQLDAMQEGLKKTVDYYDAQIQILESQEKTEAKVYQLKKARVEAQLNVLNYAAKVNSKLTDDEYKQKQDLEAQKIILDNNEKTRLKEKAKELLKLQEDYTNKVESINEAAIENDIQREIQTINDKERRDLIELEKDKEFIKRSSEEKNFLREQIRLATKYQLDKIAEDELSKQRQDQAANIQETYDLNKSANIATMQDEVDTYKQTRKLERDDMVAKKASNTAILAFDKQTKTALNEMEKAHQAVKLGIISGALSTVADAVGRNTAAGKALAIAQATVDTYAGANKALAEYPPPWSFVAAGTVIAAGLMNVNKIINTDLPNVADSGGGMPSMSSAAPMMPELPTAQITQLNQQSINDIGNQAVRAYVVETDVTSNQQRIEAIRQRARFS